MYFLRAAVSLDFRTNILEHCAENLGMGFLPCSRSSYLRRASSISSSSSCPTFRAWRLAPNEDLMARGCVTHPVALPAQNISLGRLPSFQEDHLSKRQDRMRIELLVWSCRSFSEIPHYSGSPTVVHSTPWQYEYECNGTKYKHTLTLEFPRAWSLCALNMVIT